MLVACISAIGLSSCREDGAAGAATAAADTAAVPGSAATDSAENKHLVPVPGSTTAVLLPTGITGEADIADSFDIAPWLVPGETEGPSPDAVGAFRFTCLAGQVRADDPIVYPGQPGKSHLHQFFGNTGTDAYSTYASLRTTGGSTCTRSEGDSPQRSAYWMPAMLDGAGNVVKPDWINTYYKQLPASDPDCAKLQDPVTQAVIATGGKCIGAPNGIRFLVGYNMTTGQNDFTDPSKREYDAMSYSCINSTTLDEISTKKHSFAEIIAAGCPNGNWLKASAAFPQCWDGKNLDSPDHRAHIAFPVQSYCPPTHPYRFPEIAVSVHFRVDANFQAGSWRLSADAMYPTRPAGSTLHFDYWEAWSPAFKALWQTNCIDGHLSCSSGNVGDGRRIKGMEQVGSYPAHVTVPLSSI